MRCSKQKRRCETAPQGAAPISLDLAIRVQVQKEVQNSEARGVDLRHVAFQNTHATSPQTPSSCSGLHLAENGFLIHRLGPFASWGVLRLLRLDTGP